MINREKLAKYIIKLRNDKNYSQRKLAMISGVSNSTISRLENATSDTDPKTLKKLASCLNTSYEELMCVAGYLSKDTNDDLNTSKTKEKEFLEQAKEKYGYSGKKQAHELLNEMQALFDGGELPEEDREEFMKALMDIYWDSKKRNKKYGRKKNNNN